MTSILLIGLAIVLALYLLLTKTWLNSGDEPRKAKKQEKAEIMRQLLALSDRENNIVAAAPPLPSAPRPHVRVSVRSRTNPTPAAADVKSRSASVPAVAVRASRPRS